jgi:hypothetical protein
VSATPQQLYSARLYAQLPAIYRTRDADNGYPLRALVNLLASQAFLLRDNIDQLYHDLFIETCASWVIPYIGDLVGASSVYKIGAAVQDRRAEVANTIGYRRRKGTLLALEQAAMDVSGMPAAAVEFFKRLITNESMKLVRPAHAATLNLRDGAALDRLDSAFDALSRTVDVRRIVPRVRAAPTPDPTPLEITLHGGGKYNIPNIGVYLWRWKPRPVLNAPAFPVDARRFLFSPLGQNMPLFNLPPARASFSRLTTRLDVAQPISRREFADNLRLARQHPSLSAFYGPRLAIQLFADGAPVDLQQICIRDLSDAGAGQWNGCTANAKIAIDPELGRIQFGAGVTAPRQLRVNYVYGFPADLGGGPYARSVGLESLAPANFTFHAVVGSASFPTLESAVASWNHLQPGATGLIALPAFESYAIALTGASAISLPAGSRLYIAAGQIEEGGVPALSDSCVTLRGSMEICGKSVPASGGAPAPAGQVVFSGLWISGSVEIWGEPSNVQFADCTLVPGISLNRDGLPSAPGDPSIVVGVPGTSLSLTRSIGGPIAAVSGAAARICSSIVDSSSPCAVAYAGADLASEGADLHIEDSTVVGKVWAHATTLASNTIFFARLARHDPWKAALWSSRRQTGSVRFCFLPADAITPTRFHCLPPDPASEELLLSKFVSLQFGGPSYALLSGEVPLAVWTGADNGSQMGAYKNLQETEAVRNVQLRAPEFLPFNLEAGIFLIPSAAQRAPLPPPTYGYGRRADPCGDTDELLHVGIGAHLI